MRGRTRAWPAILIFASLSSCWIARAIADDLDGGSIYLAVIPDGEYETPRLRDIIFDSAVLELERIGYTTYPAKPDGDIYAREGELASIFQRARQSYASSLILVSYMTHENSAVLILSLFDTSDEIEKAAVTMSSDIDLFLDAAVAASLNELVEKSGIGPAATSKETQEMAGAGSGEVASITAEQTALPTVAQQALHPEPDLEEHAVIPAHRFFNVSAGFAPFIAIGEAGSYFPLGMEPSLLFGLKFNAPLSFLQAGILLRMTQFTAEGVLLETKNYLLSAGPDIRLIMSSSGTFSVYLHLAGGPSGFFLSNEIIGEYWKIIPFASCGGGVSLVLNSMFGLTVNIDYSVYFEKSILIMGVSPSINVYVDF